MNRGFLGVLAMPQSSDMPPPTQRNCLVVIRDVQKINALDRFKCCLFGATAIH